jgi:hypothetical protein
MEQNSFIYENEKGNGKNMGNDGKGKPKQQLEKKEKSLPQKLHIAHAT